MWILNAVLIFAAWTAVGFAVALLFFRLGFGFQARSRGAGMASEVPQPERDRRRAAGRPNVLPSFDKAPPRRFGETASMEPLARGRREHVEAVKATG